MNEQSPTIIRRRWRHGNLTLIAIALLTINCGASPTSPSGGAPLEWQPTSTPQNPNTPTTIGGRTFFVSTNGGDSNPGTREEPWRVLSNGAAQLRAGDTVYVRGGTYQDDPIRITTSGTASNPITIAGFEEEEVILYSWPPGAEYAISFGDATGYLVVERLIFDGRGRMGAIVLADSSHHIRFKNVEVRNALNNGIIGGGSDHEFIDLKVHGSGWSPDHPSNGLYLTTNNSTIVGGEFYDNACYGVRIFNSGSTATSVNNAVTGGKFYGNGYLVGLGGRSLCSSGGGGLVLGDVNNRAENNLVYENAQGITVYGFKLSNGIKIVGNTVLRNFGSGIEVQRGAANAELRDNNLSGNGTGILDSGTATIRSNNGPQ